MDELQISGKRFISSRRLAREHGYTADYLGQLIRGGKVTGQKVGRAWYVDAASFDAYLGGEAPAPIRAAVIEEPAVAPAVEPTIAEEVVEEEVVEETPQAMEVVEEEVAQEEAPNPVVVAEIKKAEEPTYHIPLHIIKKAAATEEIKEEAAGGLRYFADDEPSLPEIRLNEKESRVAESAAYEVEEGGEAFAPASRRRSSTRAVVALAGVGMAIFVFSALVSSALSLNLSIDEGNTASASYGLQW